MVAMIDDAAASTPPSPSQRHARPVVKTKVSARKRAANRANAKNSTGPKTAAGKARSALNAVRHGVLAQTTLLPGEDEAELAALAAEFEGDYTPVGPVENALVQRLVAINWRLRRLAAAEESIAWSRICDRYVHHQQRLQVYEQLQQDAALAGPEPAFESHAGQILADDLKADGSGKLQQLATMEIRLTGQMLGVVRQMIRLRDLRNKAAREGGADIREGAAHEVSGRCDAAPAASGIRVHSPLTPCAAPCPSERRDAEAERARARAEDADTSTEQAVDADADAAVAGDAAHGGTRSDDDNVAHAASQTKSRQQAVAADAARSNEATADVNRAMAVKARGRLPEAKPIPGHSAAVELQRRAHQTVRT
jgi:hypothetical protein